jgi:hypothetical protein
MPKKYLTDERKAELVQIAKDMHAGRIFTDRHCRRPEDVSSVFMVLTLMGKKSIDRLVKRIGNSGMLYEYLSEAAPTGVNGMPMFFSMRHLTDTETGYMMERLREIEAVMDAVGEDKND